MTRAPTVGSILLRRRGAGVEIARVVEARPRRLRLERQGVDGPRRERLEPADGWTLLERHAADLGDAGGWLRRAQTQLPSERLDTLWRQHAATAPADAAAHAQPLVDFAGALGLGAGCEGRDLARLAALTHSGYELERDTVRPRSAEERAAFDADAGAASAAMADGEALARLQDHLARFGVLPQTPPPRSLLGRLEQLALGSAVPDSSWRELLGGRARSDAAVREGAAAMLGKLGVWDGHDDLAAMTSGLLVPARRVGRADPARAAPERDATDLPLVAIDSDAPHEIDDAIYAEVDGDDVRWWIAFAAPTCWIAPHGAVDVDARARGASLYHPRYHASMLDADAVRERGSLLPGERREAFVLRLRIDRDGNCTTESLELCWVRVAAAWTYDAAERAIVDGSAPPWLAAAWLAAQRSEAARVRQGAYLLYRADVDIVAPAHREPTITSAAQLGPSRRVVSEAMVRAGMAVAAWLEQRAVAAPFRVHAALRAPPLPPGIYSEPADVASVLLAMGPAKLQPRAGQHDILGASAYLQIGSPLRRYGDLLAQHQLHAALRGAALPFDAGGVVEAIAGSDGRRRALKALERRGRRYFQLLVLARMGLGHVLRAQLTTPDTASRPRATIPSLGLDVELPSYAGPAGQWVELVVEAVDPVMGRLELRLR